MILKKLLKRLENDKDFESVTIDKIVDDPWEWRVAVFGCDDYAGYGKTIEEALENFVKKFIK